MKDIKGQNAVEYVLLVVAVLTVLIIFLNPNAKYRASIEHNLFSGSIDQIKGLNKEIQVP